MGTVIGSLTALSGWSGEALLGLVVAKAEVFSEKILRDRLPAGAVHKIKERLLVPALVETPSDKEGPFRTCQVPLVRPHGAAEDIPERHHFPGTAEFAVLLLCPGLVLDGRRFRLGYPGGARQHQGACEEHGRLDDPVRIEPVRAFHGGHEPGRQPGHALRDADIAVDIDAEIVAVGPHLPVVAAVDEGVPVADGDGVGMHDRAATTDPPLPDTQVRIDGAAP